MEPFAGEQKQVVAVLLASPLTEAFEMTVARAADLKARGETVAVLYCDGRVAGCAGNPLQMPKLCSHCRRVRNLALHEQFAEIEQVRLDDHVGQADEHSEGRDMHALQQGVRSTVLTSYRIDIAQANTGLKRRLANRLAANFLEYSVFVSRCVSNYLRRVQPSRIEFFNGRLVPYAGVLDAARRAGTPFSIVEVSGQSKTFFITENATVHELSYLKGRLRRYAEGKRDVAVLGTDFFEKRRRGERTNDRSYVVDQKKGLVRIDDGAQKVVSVFLSSTDEFEIFGDDWFTQASRHPERFVAELRALLPGGYALIVRMHPNQRGDQTGVADRIKAALNACPNVTVIPPDSPHSSYELLDLSAFVVTFGSTIGLEATYWGRPSLLAGRCMWEDAGVAHKTPTAAEAAAAILGDEKPLPRSAALVVGAYLMDKHDVTLSLTWSPHPKTYGFAVNGRSYLPEKRESPYYYLSRAVERFVMRST